MRARTMILAHAVMFFLVGTSFSTPAPDISPCARAIFNRKSDGCRQFYEIRTGRFHQKKFNRMLKHLGVDQGTDCRSISDEKHVAAINSGTRAQLTFNKRSGRYMYRNPAVTELSSSDLADTTALRFRAREHIEALLGTEADDYVLRNREIETMATRDVPVDVISRIGFRFVRVLQGRPILGNTSHFRLFLGGNGEIAHFLFNDPDLIPKGSIHRKHRAAIDRESCPEVRCESHLCRFFFRSSIQGQ